MSDDNHDAIDRLQHENTKCRTSLEVIKITLTRSFPETDGLTVTGVVDSVINLYNSKQKRVNELEEGLKQVKHLIRAGNPQAAVDFIDNLSKRK